ncbi:hypothetical protein K7G42_00835 [Streptococcus parauberis]|uniref:Uncharacterized protein n=1 Tax=Streptococcus parauberis KRS-02083 TaxID=1207545 RepID=A0ABN0IPE9_9STRE|nr:hypothetical protein [Streptococcus parauberis]EMG24690.1 hypothetical protein SPJ1_1949 [Streptococcus parauberis KRS-02083]QBX27560.1 hypothetical protein Javan394_0049 [Streptococcus phage Javan394]WEM65244.1 hypothetical protein P1T45_00845 [Streptococcus parauberis]WOF47109.1 hypothetical protein K7G42_00835 [Streptococcus parauberis]
MTSIKMKNNLYKEKIGGVKIRKVDSDDVLNSVFFSDKFPLTLNLNAQVELFNIKPDHDYLLMIYSMSQNENSSELLTIINTKREDMLFDSNNDYGKTVGYFSLNLAIDKPQDKLLFTVLIDSANSDESLDEYYNYLTFAKKE